MKLSLGASLQTGRMQSVVVVAVSHKTHNPGAGRISLDHYRFIHFDFGVVRRGESAVYIVELHTASSVRYR